MLHRCVRYSCIYAACVNPTFNWLYTEFHYLEVLLRLLIYTLYFHFCYELALETLSKCSSIKPLRVYDLCHAHSLATLQWSGLSAYLAVLATYHTDSSCPDCWHKYAIPDYLRHWWRLIDISQYTLSTCMCMTNPALYNDKLVNQCAAQSGSFHDDKSSH